MSGISIINAGNKVGKFFDTVVFPFWDSSKTYAKGCIIRNKDDEFPYIYKVNNEIQSGLESFPIDSVSKCYMSDIIKTPDYCVLFDPGVLQYEDIQELYDNYSYISIMRFHNEKYCLFTFTEMINDYYYFSSYNYDDEIPTIITMIFRPDINYPVVYDNQIALKKHDHRKENITISDEVLTFPNAEWMT